MVSNISQNAIKRKKKYKKKKSVDTKVAIIQLVLAAFSLIIVTIGATYAYFKIDIKSNNQSTKINTKIQDVGCIILSKKTSNMFMNLTSVNMIKQDSDINFYASSEGKTTEPTEEVLSTITVSGEGVFNCEYDLVINASNQENMYTVFQNMSQKSWNQIILTANGINYDFNTENLFPIRKHFTINDLEEENPAEITGALKIVNRKDIDQSDLAGTNINLSFAVENFNCQISAN